MICTESGSSKVSAGGGTKRHTLVTPVTPSQIGRKLSVHRRCHTVTPYFPKTPVLFRQYIRCRIDLTRPNPCSNGILIEGEVSLRQQRSTDVLILVLMEYL